MAWHKNVERAYFGYRQVQVQAVVQNGTGEEDNEDGERRVLEVSGLDLH